MRRVLRRRSILALVVVTVCVIEILLTILGPWSSTMGITGPHIDSLKLKETQPFHGANKTTRIPAITTGPDRKQVVGIPHVDKPKLLGNTSPRAKNTTGSGNQKDDSHNKTATDLDVIIGNLTRPWISNTTRKAGTRNKLNGAIEAGNFAILTKRNTVLGQNVTFAINSRVTLSMTKEVFQMLPEESPLANLTFKSCSVVGNSGILSNSHCGKEIDKADFVFRCNTPPLKGYEHHAGIKASVTSINPGGVIDVKYRRLTSVGYRTKFLKDMKPYGDLLVPVYGVNLPAYRTSLMGLKLLRQKASSSRGLIINPDHFRSLQDMWGNLGLKSRMTTGFYLASVALSVCDSVDLYGYWPFHVGIDHHPVTYHYYDKMKISKGVHNFDWEFDVLYRLHMSGVLRMHVGSC